ncbi:MAG: hypothetical protein RLO81_11515 [Fulvivirga sp.]|uniref:hypothetical protein n=1 Tax=Fulvivirga sp. TaxID=1931237 RepID=UPI0032EC08B4
MKKVIEILKLTPWVILGGLFMLISLPFMLIAQPFIWIANRTRERQFKKYLEQLEGKNFFCYNNKSKSLDFIENNILPNLPESVEVIFLNGRTPESEYERKFISHALYGFKNYHGFPHLLKIRNGSTIDESMNNKLFNTIHQNKPIDEVFEHMNNFFEIENGKKNAA